MNVSPRCVQENLLISSSCGLLLETGGCLFIRRSHTQVLQALSTLRSKCLQSQVRPGWDIPLNALSVTIVVSILLSLIIIGSPIAFNILTSLSLTALLPSYLICIVCVFWKRWSGEPFPVSGRFSLGKAGYAVNAVAFSFLVLAWILLFFPTAPNPGAAGMNWSVLIFPVCTTSSSQPARGQIVAD